jgi:hypothetical protein
VSKLKITAGIKKVLRILLFCATGVVLLAGMLYLLLQTSYVQTALVQYITQQVKASTGVTIQIGHVDFRPVKSLVLKEVLLKDFKNDTLLYCQDLRVKADSFNIVNKSFTIGEIVLNQADFNLWISRGEGSPTNIEMFLDSLQRVAPADTEGEGGEKQSGWLMGLKKVSLRDSRFTYREEEYEPVDYGVNWTDVECRDLNVDITDFDFGDEYSQIVVSGLSFIEKSGLRMKELDGRVRIRESNLTITDARIELERSSLDLMKLEFSWTPDQHDWRYFTTRVQQYYELGPSSVSFIDLAYFNGVLRGIDNTVRCSGIVNNTINKLEGHDLYFELGDKTVFQGSFKSEGLPDVWNTRFHIDLYKAHLNPDDLETVYLPWFDRYIPVPEPLHHFSFVDFESICFEGTLSDFMVKAKSITPALAGNLTFRYAPCPDKKPDCDAMGGDFHFYQVDCGKLSGLSMLGYGSLSGSYAGVWDTRGPSFHIDSKVERLNIHQGNVKDMKVAMTYETGKLDVMATVENEQMQGGVLLAYDLSDSLNFLSTRGQLRIDELAAFGLDIKGGQEALETSFEIIHAGQENKSFTNLSLTDFKYTCDTATFTIDKISMEDNQKGDHNTTTLKSDVVDLFISGNFRELRPAPFVFRLMQNYLPAYSVHQPKKTRKYPKRKEPEKFDFQYTVQVKDAGRILQVLYPDLYIASGTLITSDYRNETGQLRLRLTTDSIGYEDISLLHSKIDLVGDMQRLDMKYTTDRLIYGNGYQLYNVRNELTLADNHLDNRLSWCNWGDKTYSGELSACVVFSPDEKYGYNTEIRIHPGVIVMNDSVWRVKESSVFIAGKEIDVSDFFIQRGKESLSVNGKLSESTEEKLFVKLENFNLENVSRIALKHRPFLFGIATGSLTLQDYYKNFMLITDFNVDNWGINRDTLGSLSLRSYWDADNRNVIVGAENRVDDAVPLVVQGYYTPEKDTIDVGIHLEKVGLERLGIYASDFVTETAGNLSGNVRISGNTYKPDISGFVYFDSVGMKVNVLNTKFFVHDSVHIVNNHLLFRNFYMKDIHGQQAVLNGEYQFWENRYRLDARFEKFMVLNTGFADNESFYGQVYLSGLADLDNHNGVDNVTVNARTENDSRLYLPLSAGMTEQSNNFLHFVHTGQPENQKIQPKSAVSDINLNANLEVNDKLNVQVIFDPTVGDILKTTGNGDIKITFDKDGNLNMFGEYQIAKGDYLFTLSNLVNKKFVLTPGGTISWSGSPYEAMLNINAVYNLKTTITELLPAEKLSSDESNPDEKIATESGRKVPVECILNLSDNLTNPVVKFDINFPTLETQSKSYIQSLFSSQDEINKQMFSLLVLNRFYRTDNTGDYGLQAQTAGVTTLTEMFSNQLSRWFSQFSSNVDIGFAYRRGDREKEMTSDEFELAVSTQLLDDRITISANGNMDVGGNRNAAGDENRKNNIAGDFDIEVKLNKQGSLKMKAYSHTNEKLLYNNTETIQGVGVSYQESFDTLRELLRKYFGFLRKRK